MRIAVSDGRVIIGAPQCVDGAGNVILTDAAEYREKLAAEDTGGKVLREKRFLGAVIVPGTHIVSLQLSKDAVPAQHADPAAADVNGVNGVDQMADELMAGLQISGTGAR